MTHTEAVTTLASERYLLDEMNESERDAFEAHYFECDECAADVTTGARMQDGVKAGLIQAPQAFRSPARIAEFTPAPKRTAAAPVPVVSGLNAWYRSAMLPWAVAATLAVIVGYQTQRPSGPMVDGQTVEVLGPVLVRPASRGSVPSVRLSGHTHVALALDVDAAGATEVAYELRNASAGTVITTGRGAAPAAGAPLVVVIPSFTLTAEERYILTVRDASTEAGTLGEYPFATIR